jgi:hypothetical protein
MVVATYVFPAPSNTGATAKIVVGVVTAQITGINRAHTEATRVYRTYHNVDQVFKKMIIDAFDDPSLNALSDAMIGYTNCASLQFFLTF